MDIAHRTINVVRKQLARRFTPHKSVPTAVRTLGDRIRLARFEKGLGKYKLAKMMGISPARLGYLERDVNEPTKEEKRNLESILAPYDPFQGHAPNT